MINTATTSLQSISQNHQSDNYSSAKETYSIEANTVSTESFSRIDNNSLTAKANSKCLNNQHLQECCHKRGLNPDWIKASCFSIDQKQASEFLRYSAKSSGILISGANGQSQFKPNKPWANKQGKKAPKYRTALGDEYDALLPNHPTDSNYWLDLEKLRARCYQIDGHPMLLVTEGGFKAIAACSHDIPTIALLGVEMGLTPSKDDPQGKRYLVPTLEVYANAGFGFILGFDCDTYSNKSVRLALIKLAYRLQKFSVPVYTLPKWDESEGKGIDDYIQKQGIEAFRRKLIAQAVGFTDWLSEYGSDVFDKKSPKADIIGRQFADQYRDRWIYCDELRSWLVYGLEAEGIWTIVSKQFLAHTIDNILEAKNIVGYGSNAYIQNILGALERKLFIRKWDEKSTTEYLPFRNGVLELATNQLLTHNPEFRFTWQLPRDYTVVETGFENIDNWLDQATRGNAEHKQLLICFAAAVLRGRNDLQKFLHLIGGGGSGKSTFTTLLTALVGEENTATLNLTDLEDKHEIARILGKRLVVLPDQDKAPKKMSNFKRLTGQDRLSGRRLFENGFEFVFSGLAVVTSNFPVFHTNVGSWLTRRVSMIPFEYQCPNHQKRDLISDFKSELGAFTSYLLSIESSQIDAAFKGERSGKQTLSSTVWSSQIRSDGLAAWVNDWVIASGDSVVKIGSNRKEWVSDEDYNPNESTLYGSYSYYCQRSGRSAKSPQNFSAELLELVNRTLNWSAEKTRTKINGQTARVIKGLRLRSLGDDEPTIEEILEGDNQGDNQGDNLKALPNKEGDRDDNLNLDFEKDRNNFSPPCDSQSSVTHEAQVKSNISLDASMVVTPVTNCTQQEFEPVTEAVTEAVPLVVTEINWQSYPYSSKDTLTLKNRANKVKERVLSCTTNNQLISLHAAGKVSKAEIDWLKSNLLTRHECANLEAISARSQTSLFAQNEELTADSVKKQINTEVKRIGWSKKTAISYIEEKYSVSSRQQMTIQQLIELRDYLQKLHQEERNSD